MIEKFRVPQWESFPAVFKALDYAFFADARQVKSKLWQGVDISAKPEMAMYELRDVSFKVGLGLHTNLELWKKEIDPNYPWVDDHFEERVCGSPINPGWEWRNWPHGNSAANFLDENGQFNHNYMERYWPKFAGVIHAATENSVDWHAAADQLDMMKPHVGIHYGYGDLSDVVDLLVRDPLTRQAYFPVWFPEDTGGKNGRAPCTLGYQFMLRDGALHVTYFIRSCDYIRHMRDDVYLTLRLALWVLEEASKRNRQWGSISLGDFQMHINSLHMFTNDWTRHCGQFANKA